MVRSRTSARKMPTGKLKNVVWNHVEIMFEPAFLKSTVAIRLMTGHIMQMIIAEIASVITIGLSFGVTMRNASAWASLSTIKNPVKMRLAT